MPKDLCAAHCSILVCKSLLIELNSSLIVKRGCESDLRRWENQHVGFTEAESVSNISTYRGSTVSNQYTNHKNYMNYVHRCLKNEVCTGHYWRISRGEDFTIFLLFDTKTKWVRKRASRVHLSILLTTVTVCPAHVYVRLNHPNHLSGTFNEVQKTHFCVHIWRRIECLFTEFLCNWMKLTLSDSSNTRVTWTYYRDIWFLIQVLNSWRICPIMQSTTDSGLVVALVNSNGFSCWKLPKPGCCIRRCCLKE